jgi:hypothetical protein
MMGLVTQGAEAARAAGSALGYPSDATLGLHKEEAASCRFTNA